MANLTITVNDELLKRARIIAIERGTSVNAVLREYLKEFVGEHPIAQARREFVRLAKQSSATSGKRGRSWNRDDLHE